MADKTHPYIYRVTEVVKVTDGDTYWLRLDVGFRQTILVNVRLADYDTPEVNSGSEVERLAANLARSEVARFFDQGMSPGNSLWVRTRKDPDNFGRWIGEVWIEQEDGETVTHVDLGSSLSSLGLASKWPIRWREEYDR